MEELFRLMERMSDEQLERVVGAEKWCAGFFSREDGARCLAGHASGYRDNEWLLAIPRAFDGKVRERLCEGLGAAGSRWQGREILDPDYILKYEDEAATLVGRECSAKAAEILAARRARKTAVVG